MCAGKVMGYDKFKALNVKKSVLFGVGMAPAADSVVEKIIADNNFPRLENVAEIPVINPEKSLPKIPSVRSFSFILEFSI